MLNVLRAKAGKAPAGLCASAGAALDFRTEEVFEPPEEARVAAYRAGSSARALVRV